MQACPKCGSSYTRELERCGLDGERLVDAEGDPLIGRTIDRYRIEALIGDGGMARVYRATQVYLGQECAIKVLFGEVASDRSLARRFQREARASSQLGHPNVVRILDFGQTPEGLTFMVMELLRGRTLSDLIRDEGPLPPARAAYLARQLAEGLAAAHALGFVHRDLKPKNVMLTGAAGRELAKLLDFGLVRITGGAAGDTSSLTQQGQVFGTPAYMAPEQVSAGDVGPPADLYALGVVLYQLLTGKLPFGGPPAHVALQHVSEPPPPLEAHGGLGALAMRCLAKDPVDRPASAQEITAYIDGLGLVTERPMIEVSIRPTRAEPSLQGARAEPAFALSDHGVEDRTPSLGALEAQLEPSPDSLPPLSVPIGAPPLGEPSGRGARARSASDTEGMALEQALEAAGLGARRRLVLPVVLGGLVLGVLLGGLYLRSKASPAGDVAPALPASSAPERSGASDASGAEAPALDAGAKQAPDATVARSDGGPGAGAARVDRDAGVGRARPPGRRGARPRSPDEPSVEASELGARDRALGALLAARGLAWADLGAYAPDAVGDWALWRIGADRPTRSELDDTALELERAARAVKVDRPLLETKLDRVRAALAEVPEGRRGADYAALLERYRKAAHQLGRAHDAVALAGELSRLEAEAARASGR